MLRVTTREGKLDGSMRRLKRSYGEKNKEERNYVSYHRLAWQ
jgi:hypothetical protein